MKTEISKKQVDSIKKRKTRRGFSLDIEKISKNRAGFEILSSGGKTKKGLIKNSRAGFLRLLKEPIIFSLARASAMKIISIALIICLNWLGISAIGRTTAFFIDNELSKENAFSAGTLDFSLSSPESGFIPAESASNMKPGDRVARGIEIKNDGSLPFNYQAGSEKISGDDDFCGSLKITAELEGEINYDGDLLQFESSKTEISGLEDQWFFTVYLPAAAENNGNFINKTCNFKLIFKAWQIGKDEYNSSDSFTDKHEIKSELSSGLGGIRLNEFLPNPSGSEASGEWVELYNNSDSGIDVAGWALYDSNDNHVLAIDECFTKGYSTIVPPKGFLVVYRKNEKKCSSDFSLNNKGDEVRLYDGPIEGGGTWIDGYIYGDKKFRKISPTPGEGNDEPGEPTDIQTDKSYARYPDGTGDWFDPIPTPGGPNILESGIESESAAKPEYASAPECAGVKAGEGEEVRLSANENPNEIGGEETGLEPENNSLEENKEAISGALIIDEIANEDGNADSENIEARESDESDISEEYSGETKENSADENAPVPYKEQNTPADIEIPASGSTTEDSSGDVAETPAQNPPRTCHKK